MATKKSIRSKGKSSKKAKLAPKSYTFPCPKPRKKSKPYCLEELVDKMEDDHSFAKFIKDLLCDSYSSDKPTANAAKTCLSSYYELTEDDLTALCIPSKYFDRFLKERCTVKPANLLIAVPADRFK